jgi:ATP-dependent Clp protease adapter protein ClpS
MIADDYPPNPHSATSGANLPDDQAPLEPDFANADPIPRDERTVIRRLSNVLRFNDFMTVMMVVATVFSAFATWRTAHVTNLLFAVAERPYIGVQQVALDRVEADAGRVMVDCRNYGNVPANGAVVRVGVAIDGKPLPESNLAEQTENIGILSPTVPHHIFRYVPQAMFEATRAGRSRMIVRILINYSGPDQRLFCYSKLLTYDPRSGDFLPNGANDQCNGQVF